MIERTDGISRIVTEDETFLTSSSLSSIQEKLDPDKFMRCHKSYIIRAEAVKKLESRYFNTTVARVNNTEVKKGYVIDCAPQEGTEQKIGTTITLIVSDGPATEKAEVPDVTDMSYDNAKATLEAKGFTTQKISVASAKDEGKVVA